jgi:hypothetical protein
LSHPLSDFLQPTKKWRTRLAALSVLKKLAFTTRFFLKSTGLHDVADKASPDDVYFGRGEDFKGKIVAQAPHPHQAESIQFGQRSQLYILLLTQGHAKSSEEVSFEYFG